MTIEIKKSIKPVKYNQAIKELEDRVDLLIKKKAKNELIWFLEHPPIFTGGSSYKESDIIDKSITVKKTSRGGKITWHGPGQLICYFVINLNERGKDIRNFITILEQSIIKTLDEFNIKSESDRKKIGIWHKSKKNINKVGAIGIRVKKWIAYHGFSINVNNRLDEYKKIIPCGIDDRGVTNLTRIKKQNYSKITLILEKNLINLLKI
tara:strand:- start:425 stop:1048 length:624 start_codon:yes stop_codon:yes gene_type:complete